MSPSLPSTYPHAIPIAVIGGTGISALTHSGFKPVALLHPTTPWGSPSSPITILATPTGVAIAFLSRHGLHHELSPSEVPNTANIAALRHLGVRVVLAFSAVGSLQGHIAPRDFVLPDQIIDRTKGIRESTFFKGGVVGHVGFADPFDGAVREVVGRVAEDEEGVRLHVGGTVVCMEGPQFSTRAESRLYRAWGGDVINMSALPEAKLAREAEMAYAMVCMSTDYDCWKEDEKAVDVATVTANMRANGEAAKRLVARVLVELAKTEHEGLKTGEHLRGTSKFACCTAKEGLGKKAVERIEWLLPGFFD